MGNLGWYQRIVEWSKKVGGPKNLMALTSFFGYGIFRGIEAGTKKTIKIIKKKKLKESDTVYTVNSPGKSNEGLVFRVGDKFKVLAEDLNAILIEKIGDDSNPYFVDKKLLNDISNY